MSVIADTEDTVIAAASAALGPHVRECASLPGAWSAELLHRLFQQAPAVYIAWLGGQARQTNYPAINARLDVLIVTKNARGEKARRRGDASRIGAYDILETLVPTLHGLATPGGSLEVQAVNNVFNEATFATGATVYAIQCQAPCAFPRTADPSNLDDFLLYHEDHTYEPAESAPDDTVIAHLEGTS